jgi:hypothetical protein
MARLRRLAMARGAVPVRTFKASSAKVTSRRWWERLDAPVSTDPVGQPGGVGLGGAEAGDRVGGHCAPAPAGKQPDPAGDPERLGGVGEAQASDRGDLQPAELHAAVAAVAGLVHHGDVAPGQASQLAAYLAAGDTTGPPGFGASVPGSSQVAAAKQSPCGGHQDGADSQRKQESGGAGALGEQVAVQVPVPGAELT